MRPTALCQSERSTASKSVVKRLFGYSLTAGDFSKRERLPLKPVELNLARVSGLFVLRSPSAISGLVISVVVYAVERVLGTWPSPNIGQEDIKGHPFVADMDTSSTISVPVLVRLAIAPTAHFAPHPILGQLGASVRKSSFSHGWKYSVRVAPVQSILNGGDTCAV